MLPSRVGVRASRLPPALHRFLQQLLFIAPVFWFVELLQNQLVLWATRSYGWGYGPAASGAPTTWYSLMSVPLWALTVLVFALLDAIFERMETAFPLRMVIAGGIGLAGEFATLFVSAHYLQHFLQIWPHADLVDVALSALPFWCADYLIFQLLTKELRSAHAHRSALG